ncbi:MAG: amidohydrolase family protein [Lentisphaeria bacterium]
MSNSKSEILIDTHAHVAVGTLLSRTVLAIDRKMPILPVEDLNAQMDEHGVSHAVLVQWGCSWDHHYLAQCLTAYPGRFAAIAHIDESRDDACQVLEDLVRIHDFAGLRLTTTVRSPGNDPLAIWKKAYELDAVVSASGRNVKDFADGLEPVLQELPNLRMRIEHLSRVPYREAPPHADFDRLLALASYPGVHINIDGFLAHQYPDHFEYSTFPFTEYLPFVRQAVSAFGAERCMWGSEFPFINNGYDAGVRFIREGCDFLDDPQREWILGRSAKAFWGF